LGKYAAADLATHRYQNEAGPLDETRHFWEDITMRKVLLATCLGTMAASAAGVAIANDELIKMSQNPKDWVMPAGDYANTRYSKLNQITRPMSASCRSPGPSRPACCAATKAAR
jgi:hypothetical protein